MAVFLRWVCVLTPVDGGFVFGTCFWAASSSNTSVPITGCSSPLGLYFASPLKWPLNGSPRVAPGLGTPMYELDQGHDE